MKLSAKTGTGIVAVAVVIVAAAVIGPVMGDIVRSNGHDPTPVEFVGFWQPGDNQSTFTVQIGARKETFSPTGPSHTHDDEAGPGTPLQLTITSKSEQPIVISECYIAFGEDTHVPGIVTKEGSKCHAEAVMPK